MIKSTCLANGVHVVSKPVTNSTATAVGLWLLNGSRHQRPNESGYAHFLEHLIFKGTARYDALTLAGIFEAMGGQINAYTGRELTAFHGLVPNEEATTLLALFVEVLLTPRFDDHDIAVEQDVVLQEMAMVKDNPEEMLEEAAVARVWPDHPMGWPILGSPEQIQNATPDIIGGYLTQLLKGARIWIVATGAVEHAALERASKGLLSIKEGARPRVAPPTFTESQFTKRYGIAQSCLQWDMPALPVTDTRYPALVVTSNLLGGGTTSRLFQEIREQRGLVYGIHSHLELYSDCGLWSIQTSCEPERLDECREAVAASTERLLHSGPTQRELDITRRYLKASLTLGEQNLESSMERLARDAIYLKRHPTLEEQLARLDDVNATDVMNMLDDAWARRAYSELSP